MNITIKTSIKSRNVERSFFEKMYFKKDNIISENGLPRDNVFDALNIVCNVLLLPLTNPSTLRDSLGAYC